MTTSFPIDTVSSGFVYTSASKSHVPSLSSSTTRLPSFNELIAGAPLPTAPSTASASSSIINGYGSKVASSSSSATTTTTTTTTTTWNITPKRSNNETGDQSTGSIFTSRADSPDFSSLPLATWTQSRVTAGMGSTPTSRSSTSTSSHSYQVPQTTTTTSSSSYSSIAPNSPGSNTGHHQQLPDSTTTSSAIQNHTNSYRHDNKKDTHAADDDDEGEVSLAVMAAGLGIMLGPNTSQQFATSVQQSTIYTPPNSRSGRKRPLTTTTTTTTPSSSISPTLGNGNGNSSGLEVKLPTTTTATAYSTSAMDVTHSVLSGGLASPVSAQPKSPDTQASYTFPMIDDHHQHKKSRYHHYNSNSNSNSSHKLAVDTITTATATATASMAQQQQPPHQSPLVTPPSPPPCSTDQPPLMMNDTRLAYRSSVPPSSSSYASSVTSSAATSPLLATPGSSSTILGDDQVWTHRRHASLSASSPSSSILYHRPQHRRDLSASTFMSTLTLDDDLPLSASTRAHGSFMRSASPPNNTSATMTTTSTKPTSNTSTPKMGTGKSAPSNLEHLQSIYTSTSGCATILGRFACPDCGKLYKHPGCLYKHRWEHHEHWSSVSRLLLTKHQQVQLMEAAQILVTIANNDVQDDGEDDTLVEQVSS